MNLNVPVELHNAFKATTAAQGQNMTDVLMEFIKDYVAKNSPEGAAQVKRAALYMRVSTSISTPRPSSTISARWPRSAAIEIVEEYTDRICGAKARRPGLDELMRDARRGRFDVVLVWASRSDRPVGQALPRSARRAQPARTSSSSASASRSTPAARWAAPSWSSSAPSPNSSAT